MQAVSLVRNDIPKDNKIQTDQITQMQLQQIQNNALVAAGIPQQPTTTTANFPQEITTMSDNDLISYINPSCFDQGMLFLNLNLNN